MVLFFKKGLLSSSVRHRLLVLAAAAILPMLLLFVGVAVLDYKAERAREGEGQLALARSMAATVERELNSALAGLNALSLSNSLQAGDLAHFRELALRFIATQPKDSALILLDRSGQHVIDTLLPDGSPLPHRDPAVNEVLTRAVFDTGRPMISNLFHRALGGGMIVTADMPVLRDGHVIYDLSLVLPPARFQEILATQLLPSHAISSVFDRNGVIVARVPDGPRFIGRQATNFLLPVLLSRAEAIVSSVSQQGVPVLTAFCHTQPSGWGVWISLPEQALRAPLLRSLRLALGAGLVAFLISAGVAYTLARRILVPIRTLTRLAADPASVTAAEGIPAGLGLAEVDAVAAALRHSLRERQAAMDALQALNEGLEARIREETAIRLHAQGQLAQAQRMEALGQLAGGIAHDFNNVLQAVMGGLSLIGRRAEDAASVRRLAEMAGQAAARGASITGRLLTFARRGELAGAPIDPLALLGELREMLAPTLGAGIAVQMEAPATLPSLLADRGQLETVLVNLAVNARDAMPNGGTVVLAARAETVAEGPPHEAALKPGGYVRISLRDHGVGMTPEVLARASEPFFTTKAPGQGTGLGLAMARGFAEQSGGGFALASAPGDGTTVHLWFPQDARAPAPAAAAAAAASHRGSEGPMRVLLVDDDSMVREVMAGELEARGFEVTTASDGLAALALLDASHPAELLITDHAMPGMDGLTLIRQARRRRPALPALLLTGYAEGTAEGALHAAQDRLTLLLRKPIGGEELAARVAGLRRRT